LANTNKRQSPNPKRQPDEIPIARNEDVELSMDQADQEDLEALERAEAADRRVLEP